MARKRKPPIDGQLDAIQQPIVESSTPIKEKKKKLLPRQRQFARHLMSGKTITEAARLAGYADNGYVGQIGSQVLEGIKHKMPEIMDRHGLTEDVLVSKYLLAQLNAEETEFAKHEGKITDSINVVAWAPRSSALDTAFKLHGSYPSRESAGSTAPAMTINILKVYDTKAPETQESET